MRKPILRPALGAALMLFVCAALQAPRLAAAEGPAAEADEKLAGAEACASWRWIGVTRRAATQCPAVAGWTATPLFDLESLQRRAYGYDPKQDRRNAAEVEKAAAELRRFCVYELDDPRSPVDAVPFPPAASGELVRFDQDCAAIAPAQDLSAATSWPPIAKHFLGQAGQAGPLKIENGGGVRLAFLDTQPTADRIPRQPGKSMHGYTLAHIARHLLCSPADGGRCAARITTRLALPILHFDARRRDATERDTTAGGGIGMQSDLAAAILAEVEEWRLQPPRREGPQHLILNLSLAWDPSLFGGLDEEQVAELRAGTQSVYRALRYAEKLDVLVLAAAGNQTTCSKKGPLLPAAWEARTPAEGPVCGEAASEPLLYAVGGVGSHGKPIANAREGGMPRRAAVGDNAVVAGPEPGSSTWLFSGSSVSTAVASSTAALVWSSFPDLRRREVMEILDRSGDPLELVADFWFGGGTAPRVSRVSACTALQAACDARAPGEACPLTAKCAAWEPVETTFPAWASQPISTACNPWIAPQPEQPPCPPCAP